MLNKPLSTIELKDLNDLIENAVAERKTIEYKSEFPIGSDDSKKEFLADVSSFANASGGDLIFGVVEKNGLPKSLKGINSSNPDLEVRKYESIILAGIEPRITFESKVLDIGNDNKIFIWRIDKSWSGPHRVIFKAWDKFYGRSSAGKYPLDTGELRLQFNASQQVIDRIKHFHMDRVNKIYCNDTPIPILDSAKVALHIIPMDAFDRPLNGLLPLTKESNQLIPIYSSSWNSRINLEGILSYNGGDDKSASYVQMYRNGCLEAVDTMMLEIQNEKNKIIPSIGYEKELLKSFPLYLKHICELGIKFPLVIFLTLIDVEGYEMSIPYPYRSYVTNPVDRPILILPEYIVNDSAINPIDILLPMFNLIWNCCGYPKSLNFDDDNNWIGS